MGTGMAVVRQKVTGARAACLRFADRTYTLLSMANRFTPADKLLPARAKRTLAKPIRWSPEEWERIEKAAQSTGEAPLAFVRRRALTGLKAAVVVLGLGLVMGCVDTSGFRRLAQADQDAFKRCIRPIEPAIGCIGLTDMSEVMCVDTGKKTYAEQATTRARKEWLVANGCPPAMVQPAKFIADEPGEDEAPQKSPGAEAAAAAGAAAHASAVPHAAQSMSDEGGAK